MSPVLLQVAQIPHKEVHKNTNMYGFMKTALRQLHPAPQKVDIKLKGVSLCFSSTSLYFSPLGVI